MCLCFSFSVFTVQKNSLTHAQECVCVSGPNAPCWRSKRVNLSNYKGVPSTEAGQRGKGAGLSLSRPSVARLPITTQMDLLTLERLLAMWPGDCSLSPHALTSAGGGTGLDAHVWWCWEHKQTNKQTNSTNKQQQQTPRAVPVSGMWWCVSECAVSYGKCKYQGSHWWKKFCFLIREVMEKSLCIKN